LSGRLLRNGRGRFRRRLLGVSFGIETDEHAELEMGRASFRIPHRSRQFVPALSFPLSSKQRRIYRESNPKVSPVSAAWFVLLACAIATSQCANACEPVQRKARL